MTDTYSAFVNSGVGARIAGALGLPRPAVLRRHRPGTVLTPGAVLVAGHGAAPVAEDVRTLLAQWDLPIATHASTSVSAVVLDLTAIAGPADLESLRSLLAPALKTLMPAGRVILIGSRPADASDPGQAAARHALTGVVRSVAKEMRSGATANLLVLGDGATAGLAAPLRFFLSGRSAYVDGQVVEIGSPKLVDSVACADVDWDRPLDGRVAVVTGAARGIGAQVARVLARDGARVVCVDIAAAGDALALVANEVGGSAIQADVTAADTGRRILEHATLRHGGLDIVVHNAGITRDKLLANTDADRWRSVLDVNLLSILQMNETLLSGNGIREGGRIVCVSSVAGIAGNRGQTNYAASKAGVIGLVESLAGDSALRARGIAVNAVAPGFIETEMTARIPLATREIGRRLNSLAQGGLPVDVAETIGWLAWPANGGMTGNVVRVCGQSLLGA